ncbi:MAG: hypothetical protein KGL43_17480 [Burkholderiales bacterium]|nr:hypothetical protein [Burkholderiales bacterium]MDE2455382.1 hypothetical protein [Burkholderiales bacterium]
MDAVSCLKSQARSRAVIQCAVVARLALRTVQLGLTKAQRSISISTGFCHDLVAALCPNALLRRTLSIRRDVN